MKSSYDVIIIGGGHNGLVTAAYLGKVGYCTLVLERRDVLGGASVTEEDVFTGYKISAASYVASLFHPKVIGDLDLHAHGLEFLVRDPPSFTPFADGSHLFSCLEQEDTIAEIARFSQRDAQRYAEYEAMLTRIAEQVEPLLLMTPPDPTSRKLRYLWQLMGMGKMANGLADDFLPAPRRVAGVAHIKNARAHSPCPRLSQQTLNHGTTASLLRTDALRRQLLDGPRGLAVQ